jgi:hypothetical protein
MDMIIRIMYLEVYLKEEQRVSKSEGFASGTYFYMITCEDFNGGIIDQGLSAVIRN